ncbi:ribonuclease H-like protein [Artomyces pyxidatus]|uniref:Ribonuclease H-like protein n=1 Tax=Artomyces pyxidatus TaxID=48021 RepID=A0ACB8TJS1_9AGAM|nr:ribonuclease H-like protein [Artomyces pyxidatus]
MFSSLGLFQSLPCPEGTHCKRHNCLFSHSPHVSQACVSVPYDPPPQPVASTSASSSTVPAKRHAPASPAPSVTSRSHAGPSEPPRKLQKVGTVRRPVAVPTAAHTPSGVPVLSVNAAQSKLPIATRQTMIKSLYDHFVVLYDAVLPTHPSLAADHALRQEQEIYNRTTKLTYRNAVITSIATLKARPPPTSVNHPSIGTADDLKARAAAKHALSELRLTPANLASLILTRDELTLWNYLVEVPEEWGPGSKSPSAVGSRMQCERCRTPYVVRANPEDECTYHWGKPLFTTVNGERTRTYTCCSRIAGDSAGCTRGPHVFYESDVAALHARHAFTHSAPGGALDVAALDCEMVYTTGGFRVARVSVVDARGKEVFDEIIKMDEGVEIIDYVTRFSGLTAEIYASRAVLPLAGVREALGALVGADTILLGHALDNDLRALRMVHPQCVDTAMLFAHPRGWPYRRALRDLTKEYLSRSIQTGGGTVGHSSVEDSVATLDLVKWFVLNRKTKPTMVGIGPKDVGSAKASASGTPVIGVRPSVVKEAGVS